MDENLLNSCSNPVQRAIHYISSELEERDGFRIKYAPAYELLTYMNSNISEEFVNNWSEEDFIPGEVPFEWVRSVVSLIKLEREQEGARELEEECMSQIIEDMKFRQNIHGRIQTNDLTHTGPLLCFVLLEPDAPFTENALQYFLSNYENMVFRSEYPDSQLAAGALALCYKNHDYHIESLHEIGNLIERCWTEKALKTLRTGDSYIADDAGLNLMALSKLPGDHTEMMKQIANCLKESQHEEGYWIHEHSLLETALATLGLVAVGEGPKISAHSVEWKEELANQRRKKSKPQFISTFPARASASHTAEIYEKAKMLTVSAEEQLRISTQYIDMLYEEIIDSIHENPDLDVRILTRGKEVAGNRQRIKKGVIDELIEVTEGNVRGNRRLHSRMVISDRRDMVVSSADLTRDQLHDEFNGGIYTQDKEAISNAITFFDNIWEESERVAHS